MDNNLNNMIDTANPNIAYISKGDIVPKKIDEALEQIAMINPIDIIRLNEKDFIDMYCSNCGSQRCEGIGTPWFEGCKHKYKLFKEVNNE